MFINSQVHSDTQSLLHTLFLPTGFYLSSDFFLLTIIFILLQEERSLRQKLWCFSYIKKKEKKENRCASSKEKLVNIHKYTYWRHPNASILKPPILHLLQSRPHWRHAFFREYPCSSRRYLINVYSHMKVCVYPTHSPREGYDTRSIF